MEKKLMPDFSTRKPQEPNEPNRFGVALLADKLRSLLIANKHRIPLIANRIRTLLIASKGRVLSLADRLRSLLVANRLRTLVISGGVLVFVAAVPIGLLIYSSSGVGDQQEGGLVSGMQSLFVENVKVDPELSRKIVFQLRKPDISFGIYTMNANGSGLKEVEDVAEDPARSPDLKKIAFTRLVEETIGEESASASASASPRAEGPSIIQVPYVFVMNADGSDERKLLDMAAAKPDWSPDGKQIVFSSDETWSSSGASEDGECDLYVVNADGSGTPRRLTNQPGCDSNPSWSPDGTKIAFTSNWSANLDVYVMNACCEEGDTNQLRQLTDDPAADTDPAWSPDGTQIAFTHTVGSNADVYKMDSDGSGKTRLTYSEDMETQPTWSPDGKKIAFIRQDYSAVPSGPVALPETTGIFIMDSDGTNPALVRYFQNETAAFPEWGVTALQDEGAEQAVEDQPTEEAISDWRALDARLPDAEVQAYIEEMNALLRGVNLHDSTLSGEELEAQNMTSSTLEGLEPSGKEQVVRFLARAGYIPAIPLDSADLSGADLSGANLSGAQWSYVNLSGANLSNANLSRAHLYGANLNGANLTNANLSGAYFGTARLGGVKLTEEQLDQAGSAGGATMTDEAQERALEAVARRALTQVAAAARSCAKQHGGSYTYCSDFSVLFQYGLSRVANVNYQAAPVSGTDYVVFSTEHSQGGNAFQFDPAAGGRIRAVPRF